MSEDADDESKPLLCHSSFDVHQITDSIFICKEHLDQPPAHKPVENESDNMMAYYAHRRKEL